MWTLYLLEDLTLTKAMGWLGPQGAQEPFTILVDREDMISIVDYSRQMVVLDAKGILHTKYTADCIKDSDEPETVKG